MVEVTGSAAVEDRELLIARLAKTFEEQLPQREAAALTDLARVFLAHFAIQDWAERPYSDILGCFRTLWTLLQTPRDQFPLVKVFNPSLDEHGWLCGRTVITILQCDMPFLVDSIRLELDRRDIPIHIVKSNVLYVGRNSQGCPRAVRGGADKPADVEDLRFGKEALVYMEISLHSTESELAELRAVVQSVLDDVALVVDDFDEMLRAVEQLRQNLSRTQHPTQEVQDFLRWLMDSHFTFLGYREYDYTDAADQPVLQENLKARRGIFRKLGDKPVEVREADFSLGMTAFYQSDEAIAFSKAANRSHIHRAMYPDYVVVKRYDEKGRGCGEARILGLFTYSVHSLTPTEIPLLRAKVAQVVERSGLDPYSHDGKNLRRVIENFPRDELFQAPFEELYNTIMDVARINERRVVRLFMRRDPFGNFVTALAYVPRDIYTTEIRVKIENFIGETIHSQQYDSTTYFSESTLARAQMVFRVNSDIDVQFDLRQLEDGVRAITRRWRDQLEHAFVDSLGEGAGLKQFRLYKNAFSSDYQESFDARTAVQDIAMLETIGDKGANLAMNFYQPLIGEDNLLRFKVLHLDNVIELSQVVPILEHLGLRVVGEHPYRIRPADGRLIWLHDFQLKFSLPVTIDVRAVRHLFEEAFARVWRGDTESDAFNKLVLGARLSWREVGLLRAYAAYMKQTTFNFSPDYIADTLAKHLDITRNLVALFKAYFNPRLSAKAQAANSNERVERLKKKILDSFDTVPNLNEDHILRHYLDLIEASLRTNFFQKNGDGSFKDYLSIKFNPTAIPGIPKPRPRYEIFVYSPRVEGVHLRGGKVARGGLRWSDRLQDYRTEILGLMKAQQVKNAVIVPTGAKGGFVAKQLAPTASREERQQEGIACYKLFIQGLLDVTDNYESGALVPPADVVRRDDDDPYLVVAADKGTAAFSDIANEISLAYNHWLGDAFASGGSQGYDHKKMGITARGAWISVQRHFRERGIDVQTTDITVIGIGDMAGDVFGNGMLRSKHIRLLGAFNHLHIFIDPNPDAATSFEERERLYNKPGSTWADYNKKLISAGGGVFSRDAKTIAISAEMKQTLAITADRLPPSELIQALLRAPVDLLWNGGIGTYVKSSTESHTQVGDKANDSLRVDGRDLRCKVIGEGGNLGMTQLGRVEYVLHGGTCNTDFIDNSAGVDSSDHEVNIKILLNEMMVEGDLTSKQRNALLREMTEEVAQLVLQNNYRQTQAISLAERQAERRNNEYRRFINFLESEGRLDRTLEFLPDDEALVERQSQNQYLTRPEIAVLISYSKMMLKEQLAATAVAEDTYIARFAENAFPRQIREQYSQPLYRHRLLNEVVATQVANDLINNLGITGAHRLMEATGASVDEVAKAYVTARDVFHLEEFNAVIRSLDNQVSSDFQADLLINMVRRVRRGTRWFLRNRRSGLNPQLEIGRFSDGIARINNTLTSVLEGAALEAWQEQCALLREQKIPEDWVVKLVMPDNLFSGLGVIEAARLTGSEVETVSQVFFALMDHLKLNWFASQVTDAQVDTYWQAMARESLIDDLEAQVRKLSMAVMRAHKGNATEIEETLSRWETHFDPLISRWKSMVNEVQAAPGTDFAMFSVALRELIDLVQATEHREGSEATSGQLQASSSRLK